MNGEIDIQNGWEYGLAEQKKARIREVPADLSAWEFHSSLVDSLLLQHQLL